MSTDLILARQAGVISRDQAIAAGTSADVIDQWLRRRRWRPLHPRVYLAAGHRIDDEVRVRAAVLWAGEGAALIGVAAAWWHRMAERAPATILVATERARPPRPRPGVAVRRRTLAPDDLETRRGLPVTTRPLTVLDAAVELGPAGAELLDRALRQWVTFPEVHRAHRRALDRSGSAAAGRMLIDAADRSAVAARGLLIRMLRDSGAGGWHRDVAIAGVPTDVAFPAARVAVGVDGWAWHLDLAQARTDERQHAELVRAGWTALHFPWRDLACRPQWVLAEIAHEVARGMEARRGRSPRGT